ncbi:MAG: ABC transporter permease [Anaerolineae bacterium]|nr:ABC transporter permease [Anaerolineae bacterium]
MMSAGNVTSEISDVQPDTPRRSIRQALASTRLVELLPILILGIVLALLAIFVPSFFNSRNIVNIFVQASTLGLMAIGMTFVMVGGGIDLSIPSVMALSAIFGAMYLQDGGSIFVACVIMLVVGCIAGCINGFAVAYLKMIPFVVTLAMMTIASGTAIWITNSVSVPIISEEFFDVILNRILDVPRPIIIMVGMAVIATIIVRRSLFGRWLYAVGTNARTARVSGIPANRVIFATYLISGLFAGLTAIILSARLGAASANLGNDGVVLDIVSSAVVGGVSIYGGVGGPLGAVLGAIFITVISNSMNMMQVSFFTGLIIKGAVIIIFVAIDSLKKR